MNIPIILGTARDGRQSEKVARYVYEQVKKASVETEIIDVRDYRIAATDKAGELPEAKKLAAKIVSADALIIVSPEYNHSFPGELKMMLDLLFDEYANKPVGLCGVSRGMLGGARGMQSLRLALLGMKLTPVYEAVYFANVTELFEADGKIKSPIYDKQVAGMLQSLISRSSKK
jgi:NAD(P)H-dependent FMN reductase